MISSTAAAQEINLTSLYQSVRTYSEKICQPLAVDDYGIQTMPDVSPPKWHLAHTTWFFETFLLKPFFVGYQTYQPKFAELFNSYYEQAGTFHPRPERGLLSRPTAEEIFKYRIAIDQHMMELLEQSHNVMLDEIYSRTLLGLHHEQQHQELMLTDIKHIFAYNPLKPTYRKLLEPKFQLPQNLEWYEFEEGVYETGAEDDGKFAYDNEYPKHKVYIHPYRIASRPVTNAEYMEFIEAGGYRRPEYWLSDGWKRVKDQNWQAPLYWEKHEGEWWHMTLSGMSHVDLGAPVCHVSYYEADAYARWSGKRLPNENEWETAASTVKINGNFRESDYLQPVSDTSDGLIQMFGDVWEWTNSSYSAYPGYKAPKGAIGEYNGKFMCNQLVLRGGSCVTPIEHIRCTYRNFFYPKDKWQFSGIRLAEDV